MQFPFSLRLTVKICQFLRLSTKRFLRPSFKTCFKNVASSDNNLLKRFNCLHTWEKNEYIKIHRVWLKIKDRLSRVLIKTSGIPTKISEFSSYSRCLYTLTLVGHIVFETKHCERKSLANISLKLRWAKACKVNDSLLNFRKNVKMANFERNDNLNDFRNYFYSFLFYKSIANFFSI